MTMQLNEKEKALLRALALCTPPKGMLITAPQLKRTGNQLIKKGLAYSLNGGFGDIYVITDEGRLQHWGLV